MDIQFFKNDKGTTAFKQSVAGSDVGVFLLSGHRTTFDSFKRSYLEQLCVEESLSFTHFTYAGWDQSHRDDVPEEGQGYVQHWLEQALDLFDHKTTGLQIIVGSSMGGYMALALAQARPDRVKAVVGLAAGFGANLTSQIKDNYGEYRVGTQTEKGFLFDINPDGSLPILTKLDVTCPIYLSHSLADDVVSYKNTTYIAEAVTTTDVNISLSKDGSHKQNRPEDGEWLEQTIRKLAL